MERGSVAAFPAVSAEEPRGTRLSSGRHRAQGEGDTQAKSHARVGLCLLGDPSSAAAIPNKALS